MKYRKVWGYGFISKRLIVRYRHVYQSGNVETIRIGYNIDVRSSVNVRFYSRSGGNNIRNMKRDVVDDYKEWGRSFMEAMWCRWNDEDK